MYKKTSISVIIIVIAAIYSYFPLIKSFIWPENELVSKNQTISKNDPSYIKSIPKAVYFLSGIATLSDGDSLQFGSKQKRARLFAIDSPELAQTCQKNQIKWKCGLQAKTALKTKIGNQKITCVGDEKDKYGRLIATCYLPLNGTNAKGFINLNAWMVLNGWATAYRYYSERYIGQEKIAKQQKLGIWSSKFEEPFKWRQKHSR